MNDIAHKVTERLYGDDKVKCEILINFLKGVKKLFDALGAKGYDEFTKSLSEGRLDEYMMGVMEQFEDYFDLEELADEVHKYAANRIPNIPMSTFNKLFEICEDENVLNLADL